MQPTDPATSGGGTSGTTGATGAPPESHRESHRTPPLPQRDLVVSYVREQTIVPLKQLGRYIGFGIAGSLLLGFGVVFLGLSCLRALQTETGDTFAGDWSWVPYLITFVALIVGAAIVWLARTVRKVEKEYG
jgi:hypothetical protein